MIILRAFKCSLRTNPLVLVPSPRQYALVMGFESLFRLLCCFAAPRHPNQLLPDEPIKSLNDLIFHTRHTLHVTFDQLRGSYADHCGDPELTGCTITRLDFCREQRKPRHAYLVAHVAGKGTSREIGCIKIDRACSTCDRSSSQPAFASAVPLFPAPAGDRAKVIDAPSRAVQQSDIIFTHTFAHNGPSLLQLIAAGLVFRNVEKLGRGQVEPCYLFAAAMFRVLAGREYVAAERRKLGSPPPNKAGGCFGGGRAAGQSQFLALFGQQDVQDDMGKKEGEVFQKHCDLEVETGFRMSGRKEMAIPRRNGAKVSA